MTIHKRPNVSSVLLLFQLLMLGLCLASPQSKQDSPYFEMPVQNVTAQVGRTAKLTCVVENLGHYKVAWGYKGTGAVLTVSAQVITNNPRISIQREQRSTWVLTIENITMQDEGYYWCQVNTSPPRSISGYLTIVEPPVLDGGDEEVTVNSGKSANLTCRAHGTPTPTIRWIREDYDRIRISDTLYASDYVGSSLTLREVSQRSAGGYLCIASNGHPPSISKRVIVHVNYPPEVEGPKPSSWASLGSTISLTCLYAAHPAPRVVWMRDNALGSQMLSDEYFTVTPQDGHPPFTHNMTLSMRNLVASDFGKYTCVIKNFMGEAQATTVLREVVTTLPPPTTPTTTTTSTTTTTMLPPPPLVYGDYDDNAKNLTAPLVVNTSPDIAKDRDVQSAPSRDQHYGNRKSKNIARINLLDTKTSYGTRPSCGTGIVLLLVISQHLWLFDLFL